MQVCSLPANILKKVDFFAVFLLLLYLIMKLKYIIFLSAG